MIHTLRLTRQLIGDCSAQGKNDEAVAYWVRQPRIAKQLDRIDPEEIRRYLKTFGAWDAEELADHDENRKRLLWTSAHSAREQKTTTVYLSE